jgi:AcrR family transcriptional regulator
MRADNPRKRMLRSAALLIRERGVEATSFADVIAASGAPRGSIYHHFPGGKAQLVEEATRYAGEFIAWDMAAAAEKLDPVTGLGLFADFWRGVLGDSDFAAGCPVVAAALEGERLPSARAAAAEAFGRWQDLFATNLRRHGVADDRARSLASLMIAALEGAIILSRAQQSSAALDGVTEELTVVLREALPPSPRSSDGSPT